MHGTNVKNIISYLFFNREYILPAQLSGIWAQSGTVVCWYHATVCRHFDDSTVSEWKCGPCRDL